MNGDEESDYEEEEFLIYADFKNQLGQLELNENIAVKIIGLEGDPVAEVNGNIFKGTYDYPMGTCVFFEKDQDSTPSDPLFEAICRQKYKYFAKSNKVINFERIFMERKECEVANEGNKEARTKNGQNNLNKDKPQKPTEESDLQINMSYDEAIKRFQSFDNS